MKKPVSKIYINMLLSWIIPPALFGVLDYFEPGTGVLVIFAYGIFATNISNAVNELERKN